METIETITHPTSDLASRRVHLLLRASMGQGFVAFGVCQSGCFVCTYKLSHTQKRGFIRQRVAVAYRGHLCSPLPASSGTREGAMDRRGLTCAPTIYIEEPCFGKQDRLEDATVLLISSKTEDMLHGHLQIRTSLLTL